MEDLEAVKAMIQRELSGIRDLEERRAFRDMMEGVFLSLWETNADMYQKLQERVIGEIAWDMNRFCVCTGLVEKENLDPVHPWLAPVWEEDTKKTSYQAKELRQIIREKGTDRSKFFRGQVDKYRWMDYGSSYLPSDLNAAYLWAQLEMADTIRKDRLDSWNYYNEELRPLAEAGYIEQPFIPDYADHNAHMYYIKTKDLETRGRLIDFMRKHDILTVFHYVPLHSAPAGKKFGRFHGEDKYTTKESERLARLPMYYGLTLDQVDFICGLIKNFFELEEQ